MGFGCSMPITPSKSRFLASLFIDFGTSLRWIYVRHAPYKISYGPIFSKIILSPHYHHLHHSVLPEHWNKNFGFGLSCWDWLFGYVDGAKTK